MNPNDNAPNKNVYPIQSFLEIERLLKKLNLTPADGLRLLAEVLQDLDRQIEEHEAIEDIPLPKWIYGP